MKIIFACFLISFCTGLSAQTIISGTVKAKNDGTLPGANVYLKGTYDGTSTDAEGRFSFRTLKTGPFILSVEFLGYETHSEQLTLTGKEIKMVIELKETFNKLDAVTITAGTFEAGDKKQANTISSLDMITTAGAAGDVFGALQTLPGTTTNGESGRLFVKGGDSDESQTYIDGALVHTPYNSTAPNTATRGRFNPFMFKGTIFSTGGYSAEYGQALSSVLLLNTNDMPVQNQFDLSLLTIGPEVAGTKLWKNGAVTATLGYSNLQPYMNLVPQNFEWEKAPESAAGAISIRQKTGKTGMYKIYSSFDNGRFTLGQLDLDQDTMINYSLRNRNFFVNTSYRTTIGENLTLATSASFTNDRDKVSFNGNLFDKSLRGFHLKETASSEITRKITLRGGAEWFTRSMEQTFRTTGDTIVNSYDINTLAAFAEAELYASKRFVTRLGSRLEHNDYLNRTSLAPRLTAAWKLDETSQFSMAYGWFYQNPSDDYLIYTDKLNYERADHYTFSYQSSRNDRTLRAEIYYKDYCNLTKQGSGEFYLPETYNNNGSGFARGLDLFWRDKKSIKYGDYWISYSYLDTKRDYKNYPEEAIPTFASKHNLAVVYKHWFDKIRSYAGVNYKYSSPRVYNDPNSTEFNGETTLAYQTLDVSWSFLYKPNIIFYGAVTNLPGFKQEFGRRYSETPDDSGLYRSTSIIPGSGRFFILACFITFTQKGTENQLDKIQ
ncbi:MAG: TonB-dependent receptor [Bacteroidota bacterium]